MKRRNHSPEQLLKRFEKPERKSLRTVLSSRSAKNSASAMLPNYSWRKQYGRMKLDHIRQLKQLQKENTRLKKLVADLPLDKAILKEAFLGNY